MIWRGLILWALVGCASGCTVDVPIGEAVVIDANSCENGICPDAAWCNGVPCIDGPPAVDACNPGDPGCPDTVCGPNDLGCADAACDPNDGNCAIITDPVSTR